MSADEVEAPRLEHSPQLHANPTDDKEPTGDRYWQYVGDGARVYTHVPVTIQPNEMIKWHEIPAEDGNWEERQFDASAGWEAVKAPDNEPEAMISPAEDTKE